MVYLDNAATTPLNTAAISAMTHVMTETFGNPSSLHAYGRQASKELREAREEMAKHFEVPARSLFSLLEGLKETIQLSKVNARKPINLKVSTLITTAIEHHSVLHTMAYLEERFGFEVTYIQPENQSLLLNKSLMPYVTILFWFLLCMPITRLANCFLSRKLVTCLPITKLPSR